MTAPNLAYLGILTWMFVSLLTLPAVAQTPRPSLERESDRLIVSVAAAQGSTYQLQTTSNLETWFDFGPALPGNDDVLRFPIPAGGGEQISFARVKITDPVDPKSETPFWDLFLRVNYEWIEFQPTLSELARAADTVLLGRFASLSEPTVIIDDAPENVVTIHRAVVNVDEYLLGRNAGRTLTLQLPPFPTIDQDALEQLLPKSQILLVLRERNRTFHLINGYGVWAPTERRPVDASINSDLEPGGALGPYADTVSRFEGIADLAAYLRELAEDD